MAVGCGLQQAIDAINAIVFPLADPRIRYARGWERPEADAQVYEIVGLLRGFALVSDRPCLLEEVVFRWMNVYRVN